MKHIIRKIKIIDLAIIFTLIIALGLAGYVQVEKAKKMEDGSAIYTVEENQNIKQNSTKSFGI